MLTESDRAEVLWVVKKFFEVNGNPNPVIPKGFHGDDDVKLDDKHFVRLTYSSKVLIP